LLIATVGLFGQTAEQSLKFEAASVKPTSGVLPDGRLVVGMLAPTGGPGTSDPGRIHYPAVNLKTLLLQAFDVEDADLHGPDWLDDQFFEVNAVMPVDTTPEQFRVMLLNLLAERFNLTVHRDVKESSGYNLVVAKNGPKMTESQGDMPPRDEKWEPKVGKDGFMVPRRGQQLFVESGRLRSRWTFQHISTQQLAGYLETLTGSTVTDSTGLARKYDISLTFRTAGTTLEKGPGLGQPTWGTAPTNMSAVDDIPDIFGAVQLLGLRLEPKRHAKETIVVDHIEKLPTAN
jgi:uncharacterized protein (TIGR03435 family)